jgi:hypothetical protein
MTEPEFTDALKAGIEKVGSEVMVAVFRRLRACIDVMGMAWENNNLPLLVICQFKIDDLLRKGGPVNRVVQTALGFRPEQKEFIRKLTDGSPEYEAIFAEWQAEMHKRIPDLMP